ncbi:MAG: rod shape-determining protein RodA [Lewinellaceae bacterium]|nr:rod shape-determining protein RodA [Saprospiraceae bacterium]MCB9339696.1 rod shape-determining protein RodA [Lewinellaceae bacterium]
MRPRSNSKNIDWFTFSIYLALVGIGWAMIYTVGYGQGAYEGGFFAFLDAPVGKQLIWVAIALGVFFISYTIDWKFWRTFANIIYVVSLLLLVAVLVFGKTIKGATSWFDFGGGITLQPSEFAKFGTAIALASYLSSYTNSLRSFRSQLYAISFFMAPMLLVLLQPDAGSAIVFTSFFIVLFREGFPGGIFIIGFSVATLLVLGLVNPPVHIIIGLAAVASLFLLWNLGKRNYWLSGFILLGSAAAVAIQQGFIEYVLGGSIIAMLVLAGVQVYRKKQNYAGIVVLCFIVGSNLAYIANFAFNHFLEKHQQERILVWLKPADADPQGAAYNLNHSKMAIGSGGLLGKGFLDGNLTQGNFVPEQITDFIFCAIGEEQGFVGTFLILSLFMLLMWRIIFIAERQRSDFNRLYAYGVAGLIFVHFFINIGMTMGLMPIIGIPLPFLSKGGSSLLAFTLMISVLLKLDANRS